MCKSSCAEGFTLDSDTCACVCLKDASSCCEGRVLDNDTCSCQCATVKDCEEGYKFDQESCKCVCEGALTEEAWASQSMKCFHPNSYWVFNIFSCGCECLQLNCTGRRKMHPVRCRCECPPGNCTRPKTYNKNSCKCECPLHLWCSQGKFFSRETCTCVCPQQDSCGNGKHRNQGNCQCECTNVIRCSRGYRWTLPTAAAYNRVQKSIALQAGCGVIASAAVCVLPLLQHPAHPHSVHKDRSGTIRSASVSTFNAFLETVTSVKCGTGRNAHA